MRKHYHFVTIEEHVAQMEDPATKAQRYAVSTGPCRILNPYQFLPVDTVPGCPDAYLPVNRDYKPLGIHYCHWVDYEDFDVHFRTFTVPFSEIANAFFIPPPSIFGPDDDDEPDPVADAGAGGGRCGGGERWLSFFDDGDASRRGYAWRVRRVWAASRLLTWEERAVRRAARAAALAARAKEGPR